MNKTRIILAATGGVLALAVLVMAIFTWLAFSERTEALGDGEEGGGLAETVSAVERLLAKKPFPSVENRKRLEANRQVVDDWCTSVRKEISCGDWCAPAGCTPAQFKEQIAADVKTLLARKGVGLDGSPIVKPDFTFGPFKDYLADKMPAAAQLPKLQRQWYDLMSLIELLSTNGVEQIVDIQVVSRVAAEEETAAKNVKAKSGKAKLRGGASAAKVKPGASEPSIETYRLIFIAKPSAFVSALQELSFQDRFTVVESFGFVRERDAIAEALGSSEKSEKTVTTSGRRGRRRTVQERSVGAEQNEEGPRQTVIFDPGADAKVKVDLTVSVYDFRSLEADEEGVSK